MRFIHHEFINPTFNGRIVLFGLCKERILGLIPLIIHCFGVVVAILLSFNIAFRRAVANVRTVLVWGELVLVDLVLLTARAETEGAAVPRRRLAFVLLGHRLTVVVSGFTDGIEDVFAGTLCGNILCGVCCLGKDRSGLCHTEHGGDDGAYRFSEKYVHSFSLLVILKNSYFRFSGMDAIGVSTAGGGCAVAWVNGFVPAGLNAKAVHTPTAIISMNAAMPAYFRKRRLRSLR